MRALGDRLRRTVGDPAAASRHDISDELARLGHVRERAARWATSTEADHRTIEEVAPGALVDTPFGAVHVIERRLDLAGFHGSSRLGGLFDLCCGHLQVVTGDARLRDFDPSQALFLDIEATGLEHGAGTLAFLLGLGHLDGDALLVRQLLLREPHEEQAMLHLLWELLERFPFLVSFNGKSYDLSVLAARMIVHRLYTTRECDLKLRPHLDLLHLSRNLYRGLWTNTRLQTLEREVLGLERVDDIPGSLVPSCWYHYLGTGDAEPMARVVHHNLLDVLSMVTLAERLVDGSSPGPAPGRAPEVMANAARLLLRRGDAASAARLAEASLAADALPAYERQALDVLARSARRLGDWGRQGEALRRLVSRFPGDREGHVALAIWEERRGGSPQAALLHARAAAALLDDDAVRRRIARLERRAGERRANDRPG